MPYIYLYLNFRFKISYKNSDFDITSLIGVNKSYRILSIYIFFVSFQVSNFYYVVIFNSDNSVVEQDSLSIYTFPV